MAEFGEWAKAATALNGLENAVRTARQVQKFRDEIVRVVKSTNGHATELYSLSIEHDAGDTYGDLCDLQQVMKSLEEKGSEVLKSTPPCENAIRDLENLAKEVNEKRGAVSPDKIKQLCDLLEYMCRISEQFSYDVQFFVDNLEEAQRKATELASKLQIMASKAEEDANRRVSTGNNVSFALALRTGFLSALCFFVGARALSRWIDDLGARAIDKVQENRIKASNLREQAKKFSDAASSLEKIAKDIQRSLNQAQSIQLDEKVLKTIGEAAKHYETVKGIMDENAELRAKLRAANLE